MPVRRAEDVEAKYENTGDASFEFLCIVPNQVDKVTIVGQGC